MTQNNFKNILPYYENIMQNYEHIIKTLSSFEQLDKVISPALKQDIALAMSNDNLKLIDSNASVLNNINFLELLNSISLIQNLMPSPPVLDHMINTIHSETKNLDISSVPDINSILEKFMPIIFSYINIPTFNNIVQDIYNYLPDDTEKHIPETALQTAVLVQSYIDEYNANPNTTEKIKLPTTKTDSVNSSTTTNTVITKSITKKVLSVEYINILANIVIHNVVWLFTLCFILLLFQYPPQQMLGYIVSNVPNNLAFELINAFEQLKKNLKNSQNSNHTNDKLNQ